MDIKQIRHTNLLLILGRPDVTQVKLADACETSPAVISQLKTKTRNIGDSLARRIEESQKLPYGWMDSPHNGSSYPEEASTIDIKVAPIEPWDNSSPLHEDDVELPLFREVELSAGHGMTEVVENHGATLRFSRESLARANVNSAQAACCIVSGDSMEPILPDGSTVGIDTSKTHVTDGKMYAIDYDGMLRVKQLYRISGGYKIRSVNREYEDELVRGEALSSLRVIGKVFWSASYHD